MKIIKNEFQEPVGAHKGFTFKDFDSALSVLRKVIDIENKLHDLGVNTDGLPLDDLYVAFINLMEKELGDEYTHWISHFVFTLDFGRREHDWSTDSDGTLVPTQTTEELWRLLEHGTFN